VVTTWSGVALDGMGVDPAIHFGTGSPRVSPAWFLVVAGLYGHLYQYTLILACVERMVEDSACTESPTGFVVASRSVGPDLHQSLGVNAVDKHLAQVERRIR